MKWTLIEDDGLVKTCENSRGDINVIYPKAPKWAQKAAMKIWNDMEDYGKPTRKGTKDVVKGLWAKIISDSVPKRKK